MNNENFINDEELKNIVNKSIRRYPLSVVQTLNGKIGYCPMCYHPVSDQTRNAFGCPMNICQCGQKLTWNEGDIE